MEDKALERAGADSLLLSNSSDSVERTVGSGPFVSAIDSRDISWKTFHRSTAKNEESFLPNCAHVREYTSDSSLLRRALEIILEKETRRSQSFQSSPLIVEQNWRKIFSMRFVLKFVDKFTSANIRHRRVYTIPVYSEIPLTRPQLAVTTIDTDCIRLVSLIIETVSG